MADWIQLSTADVLAEFTPAEQKTLENIQASPASLGVIVGDVAAEFRQAISDAGVSLGTTTAGFIPPGFRAHANALARWRWLVSFPQARAMQTPERKEAAEKAEALIEAIASGERRVTAPNAVSGNRHGTWNSENKFNMRTHPTPRPGPQADNAYANPDAPADEEND